MVAVWAFAVVAAKSNKIAVKNRFFIVCILKC
jgi:hypothetical protein